MNSYTCNCVNGYCDIMELIHPIKWSLLSLYLYFAVNEFGYIAYVMHMIAALWKLGLRVYIIKCRKSAILFVMSYLSRLCTECA